MRFKKYEEWLHDPSQRTDITTNQVENFIAKTRDVVTVSKKNLIAALKTELTVSNSKLHTYTDSDTFLRNFIKLYK